MASGKDRRYGNNEYDVFLIKLMLFKKINSNLYNKAFLSSKETDEEKLEKARLWLEQTKIEHA